MGVWVARARCGGERARSPALAPITHSRKPLCCSLQALYALKAQLEGVGVEEVAPPPRAAAPPLDDDALLPLIGE